MSAKNRHFAQSCLSRTRGKQPRDIGRDTRDEVVGEKRQFALAPTIADPPSFFRARSLKVDVKTKSGARLIVRR